MKISYLPYRQHRLRNFNKTKAFLRDVRWRNMRLLRMVYMIYSIGLILFSFRVIAGVLVAGSPRNQDIIEAGRPSNWSRLCTGILRAAIWPILIFRYEGIRSLIRGESK